MQRLEAAIETATDGVGIPEEAVYEHNRDNLIWLQYVDPVKLRTALDEIFDDSDVSAVAPVHGNPILETDVPTALDRLERAAGRIADEYEVPSVED